jgi:four helix bundle protein
VSGLFDHENLRVYQAAINFLSWLEEIIAEISREVSARDHLMRASASVPVNIAEASGKTSLNERRQFIDTAYGSSLECAACLDVLAILKCVDIPAAREGKTRVSEIVSMLVAFRRSAGFQVREDPATYGTGQEDIREVLFDHETLRVYQRSLDFVRWCEEIRRRRCLARTMDGTLDRCSTAVALDVAEGNGKFSVKDRCRFIGHARTAALQAASTLDVLAVRDGRVKQTVQEGKAVLAECVRMLCAWQGSLAED